MLQPYLKNNSSDTILPVATGRRGFNNFLKRKESVRDDVRFGRRKEIRKPEFIGQRVRVGVSMLRF